MVVSYPDKAAGEVAKLVDGGLIGRVWPCLDSLDSLFSISPTEKARHSLVYYLGGTSATITGSSGSAHTRDSQNSPLFLK